jgi:hypothetical protein
MLPLLEDFVKAGESSLKLMAIIITNVFVSGSCFKICHDYHLLLPLKDILAKVAAIIKKTSRN